MDCEFSGLAQSLCTRYLGTPVEKKGHPPPLLERHLGKTTLVACGELISAVMVTVLRESLLRSTPSRGREVLSKADTPR